MNRPCAEAIAAQRAVLREVDLKLMSVAFDVDSSEAAALVGRARAEVRAAEQLLAAAARERVDPVPAMRASTIAAIERAVDDRVFLQVPAGGAQ